MEGSKPPEYNCLMDVLAQLVRAEGLRGVIAHPEVASPVLAQHGNKCLCVEKMPLIDEDKILSAMCVDNFWQSCRKEGSGAHERGSLKGMEEGSIWWEVLREEPKNNELDAKEPLRRAPSRGEEVHPSLLARLASPQEARTY